jgi:Kef-type K+ transport system membrane component KefB
MNQRKPNLRRVVALQMLVACLTGALFLAWVGMYLHKNVGDANPPWTAGFSLILEIVTPGAAALAAIAIWMESSARTRAARPVSYKSVVPLLCAATAIAFTWDWAYLFVAGAA